MSDEQGGALPSADHFARLIRNTLAQHPDWMPDAVQGLFAGSLAALERLNSIRAASDAACLAALALCDAKRLSPEARASLLAVITKPMNPAGLCALERKFAAQAIEARRAETQSGSVHESAVAESDAPDLSNPSPGQQP